MIISYSRCGYAGGGCAGVVLPQNTLAFHNDFKQRIHDLIAELSNILGVTKTINEIMQLTENDFTSLTTKEKVRKLINQIKAIQGILCRHLPPLPDAINAESTPLATLSLSATTPSYSSETDFDPEAIKHF